MSDTLNNSFQHTGARPRRSLVVSVGENFTTTQLEHQLTQAGYKILYASLADAARSLSEFAPDVMLVLVGEDEQAQTEAINLLRRLRADAATHALPIVILFREDARALRSAALGMGADDYFALASSPVEMCARLEALFWRAESGRRTAPAALDQRSEIDNFMLLLEAVRADIESGATGVLALIGQAPVVGDRRQVASISEIYGFFKLNLRRADAIAFYGPTILLAHLPRRTSTEARQMFTALTEEFSATRNRRGPAVGLVSFPQDGMEVERLVERAEGRLEEAGRRAGANCVVADDAEASSQDVAHADSDASARVDSKRQVSSTNATAKTNTRTPSPQASSEREARMLAAIDSATRSISRAAENKGQSDKRAPSHSGTRGPRRLLLVVSDAARMAQLNLLIRSVPYEVRAAFDAQQALSLLRIERPDMVVVDQDLRDMEGVEMLRRLRSQQGGRLKIPALLLIESGRDDAAREAADVGARSLVAVPYNPDEILDSIRSIGGDGAR